MSRRMQEALATALGGALWVVLVVWVLMTGGCGTVETVTVHTGVPCGDTFTIPITADLYGCAATQGFFIVPSELTILDVQGLGPPNCLANTKVFPEAADRDSMIRSSMVCVVNQLDHDVPLFTLTARVPRSGLVMAGHAELAVTDGLQGGFPEPCYRTYPNIEFVCS